MQLNQGILYMLSPSVPEQVQCSVNYHASLTYQTKSASCGKDCLGLGIEGLALSRLSIHGTEALDAQLLPGLHQSSVPCGDVFVGLLASSILQLRHDLASLVLHEIGFGTA